jgi:hypothetical protein
MRAGRGKVIRDSSSIPGQGELFLKKVRPRARILMDF